MVRRGLLHCLFIFSLHLRRSLLPVQQLRVMASDPLSLPCCTQLAERFMKHLVSIHDVTQDLPEYPVPVQFQLLALTRTLAKLQLWIQDHPSLIDTNPTKDNFEACLHECAHVADKLDKELPLDAKNTGGNINWAERAKTFEATLNSLHYNPLLISSGCQLVHQPSPHLSIGCEADFSHLVNRLREVKLSCRD